MDNFIHKFYSVTHKILSKSFFWIWFPTVSLAGVPMWTITPVLGNSEYVIAHSQILTIKYLVHSNLMEDTALEMQPLPGITASGCSLLPAKGTCELSLTVSGSDLNGDVIGGPVLCKKNSFLQCYGPSAQHSLAIRLTDGPQLKVVSTLAQSIIPYNDPNGTTITIQGASENSLINFSIDITSLKCNPAGVLPYVAFQQPIGSPGCLMNQQRGWLCYINLASYQDQTQNYKSVCLAQKITISASDSVTQERVTVETPLAFSVNGYLVFALGSPSYPNYPQVVDNTNLKPSTFGSFTPDVLYSYSLYDGLSNTQHLIPKNACAKKFNLTGYLPAICQYSNFSLPPFFTCNNDPQETLQNLESLQYLNLHEGSNGCTDGAEHYPGYCYWSSTIISPNELAPYVAIFSSLGDYAEPFNSFTSSLLNLRCAKAEIPWPPSQD